MSEISLVLAIGAGFGLGLFFFGGLWWTVRQLGQAQRPFVLIITSFLGRTVVSLLGFYVIAHGHWERLLIALLGFVLARFVLSYLTSRPEWSQSR